MTKQFQIIISNSAVKGPALKVVLFAVNCALYNVTTRTLAGWHYTSVTDWTQTQQ